METLELHRLRDLDAGRPALTEEASLVLTLDAGGTVRFSTSRGDAHEGQWLLVQRARHDGASIIDLPLDTPPGGPPDVQLAPEVADVCVIENRPRDDEADLEDWYRATHVAEVFRDFPVLEVWRAWYRTSDGGPGLHRVAYFLGEGGAASMEATRRTLAAGPPLAPDGSPRVPPPILDLGKASYFTIARRHDDASARKGDRYGTART